MLSRRHANRAATALIARFGEVAVAAAVLRAQEAKSQGKYVTMANWQRIAQAAVEHIEVH